MKSNPTVIITGSSRGIGRACALKFARLGSPVVLNGFQHSEALQKTQKEITALGGRCLAVTADVGTPEGAKQLITLARETFGEIDLLINNAGISYVGLLTDMTQEDWMNLLNTNLSSVFYCCKEILPFMVRRKAGRILNISSVWGLCGASCEAAYSATKGGLNALTMALAKELAPSNIPVNAVALGAIDTEMNRCFTKSELAALSEEIPAGRLASPEEAAEFIYEIAVRTGDYFTGQIVRFDGGWL